MLEVPLVSVIIRTTHRATLGEALASVDAQTYPNIEIVVVDALGTGITLPPSGDSARLRRVISTGSKLSYSPAANAGLDSARGDYLIFLDDDDFFDAEHVASLWQVICSAPTTHAAYSGTRALASDGSVLGEIVREYSATRMHQKNLMTICSVLFSRKLLRAGCRFDELLQVVEDWDFWLQISQHTDFVFSGRVTTNWRAETGGSGAGAGTNFAPDRLAIGHERLRVKWTPVLERLAKEFDQHAEQVMQALRSADKASAEISSRAALKIDALDADILNILAMIHAERQDFATAETLLRKAIMNNPDVDWLLMNQANLFRQAGKFADAIGSVEQFLRKQPEHAQAQRLRGELLAIHVTPPDRLGMIRGN